MLNMDGVSMALGQCERCHASRSQDLVDILAREGCSSREEGELGGVAASSELPIQSSGEDV